MEWLEAFSAWIEAPASYNWVALIGVAAAVITAFATGYSANLDRLSRRERITAEWSFENEADRLRVTLQVKNQTQTTLDGDRIRVRGPVRDVTPATREAKHESWSNFECPFRFAVKPGGSETFSFIIVPDPQLLRHSATSWLGGPRSWVGRSLWRLFGWRLEFGPRFSITSRLRRRSSPMRPIRLTAVKRIYDPMAIKMAEAIEAKADTK
jgi:hypothetical protein